MKFSIKTVALSVGALYVANALINKSGEQGPLSKARQFANDSLAKFTGQDKVEENILNDSEYASVYLNRVAWKTSLEAHERAIVDDPQYAKQVSMLGNPYSLNPLKRFLVYGF